MLECHKTIFKTATTLYTTKNSSEVMVEEVAQQ